VLYGAGACALLLAGCSSPEDGGGSAGGDVAAPAGSLGGGVQAPTAPATGTTSAPSTGVTTTGAGPDGSGGAATGAGGELGAAGAAAPSPATTPAPAGDLFCGALDVLRTSCQGCHGEELVGGAPMPLVTHADTQAPAVSDPSRKVYQLMSERLHDTQRPMPPLSQAPLAAEDLAALDAWVAAGAPDAAGTCENIAAPPSAVEEVEPEWPADCQERYEIRAHQNGQPYRVPANSELNINITVPVPWAGQGSGEVQALAIRPISNNKRVVHHWILYAGLGDFITSWSPGKPMEVFPEGVGVHMPTSGDFRLNMHYYNVGNDQDELDDSGLEVCITRDPRPNTATTYMFAGSATVPPGQRVENVSTCDVVASEPIHLITSSPHMHSYGVAAKLEIVRADGTVEVLEDAPFSWEEQHVTPVDAVINNGDQVRVTCIYENDTDRTIRFGESSEDEMCFNFARYYPMDAFSCSGSGIFGGFF
jgi:hypothetical protein